MRTVPYDDFLSFVLPYTLDCPDVVALRAIQSACIEFCELSHWLRETTEPQDVDAGEPDYLLRCSTETTAEMALSAAYDGFPLRLLTPEQITQIYGADWRTRTGKPRAFTQLRPHIITLAPTPEETIEEIWVAELVVKPTRKSTQVSAQLYEHWAEVISFGARARLYETPNQPYSDPAAGAKFRGWFKAACRDARVKTNAGVGRANLRVRMRPFGI